MLEIAQKPCNYVELLLLNLTRAYSILILPNLHRFSCRETSDSNKGIERNCCMR
jgi:hypothetical protein